MKSTPPHTQSCADGSQPVPAGVRRFFFPSRKTPFLQRLRSRLRHAWLLHFWLISALLLMPVPRLARADEEEEIFDQVPNESRVVVTVSATDGTTGMLPAMNRPVLVHAELTSREVWIGRLSGRIFYGIPQTGPLMGRGITFSASEDGSVWGSSPSTDSSGNGSAIFTMGMKASTVEVTVEGYGATGSITFEAPVETWHWDHDESLLSASFAVEGSVRGVPPGATRQVRADTVFGNWSILVSDFNPAKTKKVRTGNSNTSPAIGAEISWSIISGDGGVVPAESPSYTSGSGDAAATFTMGAVASVMRADVAYNNGSTTYATITFDPGDMQWTKTGDETTISTTLSTADAVTTFPAGEARWVTAQLVFNSSEVWVDELGNTENRNPTSGAASGAPVTFYVDSGDGTVSNAAGSTVPSVTGTSDADGFVSVLFTMGSHDSRVAASASYSTAAAVGLLDFTSGVIDPFVKVGEGSSLDVSLSAIGNIVTAALTLSTWDDYSDGVTTVSRHGWDGPAGGAWVTFSASWAANGIDSNPVSTNFAGKVSRIFVLNPEVGGTITASVDFGGASGTGILFIPGTGPGGGGGGGGGPGGPGDPAATVLFEYRKAEGDNEGGGYTLTRSTTTRTGSWDVSRLSADEDLNIVPPPWSGWTENEPVTTSEDFGSTNSYNPALSVLPDMESVPWATSSEFTPSVFAYYSKTEPPPGTVSSPYSQLGTHPYPYTGTGSEGQTIYLQPPSAESITLSDSKQEETASGVPNITWHGEELQFRIIRPPGADNTREISRTLILTQTVDNQAVTGPVTLIIAAGEEKSEIRDIKALVAAAPKKGDPTTKGTAGLLPGEFKLRQNSEVFKGWDSTASPRWTSVGVGKTNSLIKLVLPANADFSNYTLRVLPEDAAYISISNSEITGPETTFDITGIKATDAGGVSVVLCDKRNPNPFNHGAILDLHVHVLPERTVHVGIYYASADKPNPEHTEIAASALQAGCPTTDQIMQRLNDAYNAQANITFVLDDTAVLNDCYGAFQPNGDIYWSDNAQVTDAWRGVYSKAWDRNQTNLHRFFVVKLPDVAESRNENGYVLKHHSAGFTPVGDPISFVNGSLQNNDIVVYAHEMGHALNIPVLHPATDNHDGPPWPSEFSSDGIPYSDQMGLMKGGMSGLSGFTTNWMRHQDWRKANDTAKSKYEH